MGRRFCRVYFNFSVFKTQNNLQAHICGLAWAGERAPLAKGGGGGAKREEPRPGDVGFHQLTMQRGTKLSDGNALQWCPSESSPGQDYFLTSESSPGQDYFLTSAPLQHLIVFLIDHRSLAL